MDCKEFERWIPDFINREMDYTTLNAFNDHMKKCENCREELVIQFLVTEGMQRLEEGDSFDLQKELDERLTQARKRLGRHNMFLHTVAAIESMAAIVILILIVWMVR